MLHVLLPAAALLAHNGATKAEVKTEPSANVAVANATDFAMPTTASDNPIVDGHSYPSTSPRPLAKTRPLKKKHVWSRFLECNN